MLKNLVVALVGVTAGVFLTVLADRCIEDKVLGIMEDNMGLPPSGYEDDEPETVTVH